MTNKGYADIQRNLGYIEGLIADCNTIVFDGITAAIDAIDKILDEEMKIRTESLLMHDLPIEIHPFVHKGKISNDESGVE